VHILTTSKYRDSISEVRIEGHTPRIGLAWPSAGDAYFLNMELSQARTRSTLAYVLNLPADREQVAWLRRFVTANGLSSSRLIVDNKGVEDVARSRRVEFRVRTDAETRLAKILEVTNSRRRRGGDLTVWNPTSYTVTVW